MDMNFRIWSYKCWLVDVQETNNISVTIDIEEVLRINDKDYSITFSTYFNVEWKGNTVRISNNVFFEFKGCYYEG